jgi:hypothetical protein
MRLNILVIQMRFVAMAHWKHRRSVMMATKLMVTVAPQTAHTKQGAVPVQTGNSATAMRHAMVMGHAKPVRQ